MSYFFRNLPWLVWNSRKHPGLLRAAFAASISGNTSFLA
jgi:hypothetical protein